MSKEEFNVLQYAVALVPSLLFNIFLLKLRIFVKHKGA